MSRNIAVIPVRAGSTRLAKKNYIDFFGKPMFLYTYEAAIKSNLFEKVIISTESKEVVDIAKSYSIDVEYLRPEYLGHGDISLVDVCLDVVDYFKNKGQEFDNLCLLWATSPLRNQNDIISAYKDLDVSDGVVAVTKFQHPAVCAIKIDSGFVKALMPDMFWLSSQDQPEIFVDCGSMAWVKMPVFIKEKTWLPNKAKIYKLKYFQGVDLDTKEDMELLEFYFSKYYTG